MSEKVVVSAVNVIVIGTKRYGSSIGELEHGHPRFYF